MAAAGCNAPGRSVRTLIEVRDAQGETVAGATVAIDGRPQGLTDHRGLFRVKARRRVGDTVGVIVRDESDPPRMWSGSFVLGTHGGPAGGGDRLLVVLGGARPATGGGDPQ